MRAVMGETQELRTSTLTKKLLPLVVVMLALIGCAVTPPPAPAPLYPVVSGSQGPAVHASASHRVAVWGEGYAASPVVLAAVTETLQRAGQTVIEYARFQEVYNEQVRQYSYGFDEATLIRVGRLMGADTLVFVELSESFSEWHDPNWPWGSTYGMAITVTVRAVSVETGEIRWTGTARTPRPVQDEDAWGRVLAQAAVLRAVCPVERGYTWDNSRGCVRS